MKFNGVQLSSEAQANSRPTTRCRPQGCCATDLGSPDVEFDARLTLGWLGGSARGCYATFNKCIYLADEFSIFS